jgi:hypothetical protein
MKRRWHPEVLVPRKTAGTVIAADNQLALAAEHPPASSASAAVALSFGLMLSLLQQGW